MRTTLTVAGLAAALVFSLGAARRLDPPRTGLPTSLGRPAGRSASSRPTGLSPSPLSRVERPRPTLPPRPAVPPGPPPPRGTWIALVYGGNGQGEIEPCG